jgi:hypothetical protein
MMIMSITLIMTGIGLPAVEHRYNRLKQEVNLLERILKGFENNNEDYLKINQTVRDNVSSIL